jgi:predicted O-methyltransferase YrrM
MSDDTGTAPAASAGDGAAPAPSDDPLFQLLLRCYGRSPAARELEIWTERLRGGLTAQHFIRQLARSPAFAANRQVKVKNPAGHYFSPVVDPDLVVDYVAQARAARIADVAGIDFDLPGMEKFWRDNAAFIAATPFSDTPDGTHRYCFTGGPYNYGDATILRCIINAYRPRRIVEIGSGYSTACMLDAADEAGLTDFALTCIEPYPTRLKSVLRDTDTARVTIVEQGVQGHDLARFAQLERNDILFIDSTHVLKTGSDVHYELFHILPVLKPGVLVHFHDCRWPFEYSDKQIFEKNYSWNEAYGVRALLMYSTRFKVIFHGSLFATERPDLARDVYPPFMKNPGSALWVQVQEF